MLPMLHDLFAAPRYGGPEFEKAVLGGEKDFTDPDYVASIETLEEVTPYFPEDVVGVDYATAQTLFTAEKAAMYPGGSFELAFFQDQNPDLDMGVFAVPPPPGALVDQALTPGWVDASFGVNSESPDKEEALELVKWMSSQEFGQMVSDELKQMNPLEGVTPSDPLLEEMLQLYTSRPHAVPAAGRLPVRRAARLRPDGGRPAGDAARRQRPRRRGRGRPEGRLSVVQAQQLSEAAAGSSSRY